MTTTPLLFQPYTVRGITLKNRIVVSPMGTYGSENGCLSPFQFAHYERMAMGGAGLVIMEQTFVTRAGRVSNGDPGLWADSHIEPMARLVSEMKRYGAKTQSRLAMVGVKVGSSGPMKETAPLMKQILPQVMSRSFRWVLRRSLYRMDGRCRDR